MSGERAAKNVMVIRGIDGLNGKGIASTSYNSGTGVLTVTFTDSSTYQTGDIRGATGPQGQPGAQGSQGIQGPQGATGATGTTGNSGRGITSTSYNASTGVLTITFTDSSTYQTGDIRGSVVYGTTAGTACVGNDARLTDTRTPTDLSVTYGKVANALKTKATVTSTVDLSANGQGAITLSANTAFTFSGFELNKTYLLIITPNGYTASWAVGAKHVPVEGNAAFATTGVFYVSLTCIDATSGSEKLLTAIMKGA